jgi:magnesium-transporting ATPase (P-type)
MQEMNDTKKSLDLGETINEAFEIWKKTALMGGLAFMFLMLILTVLTFVGVGYFFNAKELPELMKNFNPEALSSNGMLIYFGIIIGFTVLISPFVAGMLKMAHDADHNEEVTFSSIYHYVNSPQFLDIALATTVISIFSVGLSLLLKSIFPNVLGEILGFILSYSVSILTFIAIPLVIFKSLNFIDAIKLSCSTILNNFFTVLLLMIVAGLFSAVGILAFCIGLFFTIPFAYAMQYSIYKRLG